MNIRIKALRENNIDFDKMKEIVSKMQPLPGAPEFLNWVRERAQVVFLTGSFYDYMLPLLAKLNYPMTFANFCKIEDNQLVGYEMREDNGKINMVNRFHEAGLSKVAVGDSLNDLKC